ncbi:hypothetical protein PGUG_00690 [Meyerozyma guilliermondii ATCC 6260]|uniref:Uncharacterized protein n=1 Tax=Meyerozyma guilliermondii (strain ATCC 6260 / CBS 566 / DSM 6381 / JCM 1539 / NBRC 10279 / NRRL Y-324) TaxID=294746 RepID=A5DBN5_PICGU|nr:uncharacterized protein PGUG_00690 [Meyerozyma guilliermondii ATCC 6260]EDK36593.2 hypothetical protein PGUG_00690 [Meyerozyma guilliermondii ATCC 6260]
MQSLLFERFTSQISPYEFATTVAESYYTSFSQDTGTGFPDRCHNNAAVNSIAAESLDYRYVISGCADSTMKLWDVNVTDDKSNYQCIASIPKKSAHKFGVSCVEWWPQDTGMFVSASFDHTVKVWDTNVLEVAHEFDMTGRVYSFDISASQALVAVAIDHPHVRLVDLRSTASSHTLPGHRGKTLSVKWHPHMENVVATGGFDGEIKLWDIRRSNSCIARLDMLRTSEKGTSSASTRNEVPVRAHSAPVNGLVWDSMGQLLLSAGNDDKIRVWDLLSNSAPPINKLINFGPLTRNKYPQNIPMLLNSHQETELSYLLFPSDSGDIFVFRIIDGKMVSRLKRKTNSDKPTSARTSAMALGAPFQGQFYGGTLDGEILTWSASFEVPDPETVFERFTTEPPAEDLSKLREDAVRLLGSDVLK